MSVARPENSAAGPLSVEHHKALALANERIKKVRRAAGVASFNGWVTSVFALCSALFVIFSFGVVSVLVTLGLTAVAVNEFRGRSLVRRLNPRGLKLLGWNQTFFMTMIVAYCVWALYVGLTGPNQFDVSQASPELRPLIEDSDLMKDQLDLLKDLWPFIVCAIYVPVIVLTIVFQGGNAIYYFRRRTMLLQYLNETPEWIVHVQRATA